MRRSLVHRAVLFVGTALLVLGLVGGTLPQVWACSAGDGGSESRCCCPEREAAEGLSVEAACCCVAPDPAEEPAPDVRIDQSHRQELGGAPVALAPRTTPPRASTGHHRPAATHTHPPTLVSLHTSLRC